MAHTLKANCLSVSSLNALVKQLNDYNKDLSSKCEEVVRRLTVIAQGVIEKQIALADFSYEGNYKGKDIIDGSRTEHSVAIDISNQGKKSIAQIKVTGQDIAFIEFGAGVYYNGAKGGSPHKKGEQLGMLIGTYGYGMGARKIWGYIDDDGNRVLTHGTQATMPLYQGLLKAYDEAPRVIKEVFGK
jgi:hypothetical protein